MCWNLETMPKRIKFLLRKSLKCLSTIVCRRKSTVNICLVRNWIVQNLEYVVWFFFKLHYASQDLNSAKLRTCICIVRFVILFGYFCALFKDLLYLVYSGWFGIFKRNSEWNRVKPNIKTILCKFTSRGSDFLSDKYLINIWSTSETKVLSFFYHMQSIAKHNSNNC